MQGRMVVLVSLLLTCSACASDPGEGDDAEDRCGDDACSGGESAATCPADCPDACGDGTCGDSEDAGTCSVDCSAMCGDDICSNSESAASCAADCDPICGDAMCSGGEHAGTCALDCPAVCGDGRCTHAETDASCAADCASACGDDFCSSDETCTGCPNDCGVCLPATVDITLIGALIRPAMIDGRTWDGPDLTTEQVNQLAQLATLLAGYPSYSEVTGFVANLVISAYSPPDPFGVGELAWNGAYDPSLNRELGTVATNVEDTLTPQWPGPPFPGWVAVPTGPTLRVRITLTDEDVLNDDVIGTVELNEAAIRAVYNQGEVVGVPVHDQGSQQVLFVTLSVTDSAGPTCGGECTANIYSACTCAAGDPCGWVGDGACDSFCTANFPTNHLDDVMDCAAGCSSDCSGGVYSACSCSSVDPCNWENDGTCDDLCAQAFPGDHFHDPADCAP